MALLRPMVGETCWSASTPNGECLQLNLGERVPFETKSRKSEIGSWIVSAAFDNWGVDGKTAATGSSEHPFFTQTELDWMLPALESEIVEVEVDPSDLTLQLRFKNEHNLEIGPGDAEDEPYWSVITPEDQEIAAGPGPVWKAASAVSRP